MKRQGFLSLSLLKHTAFPCGAAGRAGRPGACGKSLSLLILQDRVDVASSIATAATRPVGVFRSGTACRIRIAGSLRRDTCCVSTVGHAHPRAADRTEENAARRCFRPGWSGHLHKQHHADATRIVRSGTGAAVAACRTRRRYSLQLQSLWIIPAAAVS